MSYKQLGNNVWCDGRMVAMCGSADDARTVLEALRERDELRSLLSQARAWAMAWKRMAKAWGLNWCEVAHLKSIVRDARVRVLTPATDESGEG